MDQNDENIMEVNYKVDNVVYAVVGNADLHARLQNDEEFYRQYFQQECSEIVGIRENSETDREFIWTRAATWLLIRSYEERLNLFRNPKVKNRDIWKQILYEFEKEGYNTDFDHLDRKFRNLKKTYKTIKDKIKNKTGRGNVSWEYYDALDTIFSEDKTINPEHTLSSIDLATTSNNNEESFLHEPSTSIPELLSPVEATLAAVTTPKKSAVSPQTSQCSTGTKDKQEKRRKGKQLYELRTKQLEIEKERIEQIKRLRVSLEEHNQIQRERNEILRVILKQ